MKTRPILSADSHVFEPLELWERLPAHYRARAPHYETINGEPHLVADGMRPRPAKYTMRGAQASADEDLEKVRGGGWDPVQRMKDQDRDGVVGEVIYPTNATRVLLSPDPQFQLAAARVYNDWLAEVFGAYPNRFVPVAVIPVGDVEGAKGEMHRVAKLGFRTVLFPAHPPKVEYNQPQYDPLWATAQDLELPVNFHIASGHDPRSIFGPGAVTINYLLNGVSDGMRITVMLCSSGVLERFPGLRIATVETGCGWLAWTLQIMDENYTKQQLWVRPKLQMLPSEYFKRQGHVTFQEDPVGIASRSFSGLDCLLWGNDYPHWEGTWPKSQEVIAKQFAGVPEPEIERMVYGNAARLYRFG